MDRRRELSTCIEVRLVMQIVLLSRIHEGMGMFAIVHTIHFNTQFVSRENIIFQVFHLFYSKAS